jgi:hypothetical protein
MVDTNLTAPPTTQYKRITKQDAEQIAELTQKYRLTESEACARLSIKRERWYQWKTTRRNEAEFSNILTRVRSALKVNVIEAINRAGDGIGMKQPDWRAKAWLAERVIDPVAYGDTQNLQQQVVGPAFALIDKALQMAISSRKQTEQVIDIEPVKLITEVGSNGTQLSQSKTST